MTTRPPRTWTADDERHWRQATAELRLLYERVKFAAEPKPDPELLEELRTEYERQVAELEKLWPKGAEQIKRFQDIDAEPDREKAGLHALGIVGKSILAALAAFLLWLGYQLIAGAGWWAMAIIGLIVMVAILKASKWKSRRSKRL